MAIKYLLDTNSVIYFLKNSLPENGKSFLVNCITTNQAAISFVTRIELLAYPSITSQETNAANALMSLLHIIWADEILIDKTIEVRKQSLLKLPDALIASTALVNKLELVTANLKDFSKVQFLEIINPLNL